MKRHSLQLSVMTFLTLAVSTSLAVVGDPDYNHAGGEANTCFIKQTDKNDEVSVCTGTLIAPNKILTAAHCIPQENKNWKTHPGTVHCGFQGVDKEKLKIYTKKSGNKIAIEGVKFAESHEIESDVSIKGWDVDHSVFTLKTNSKIKPAKLMAIKDLSEIENCWISGYGINNAGYAGSLVSAGAEVIGQNERGIFIATFLKGPELGENPFLKLPEGDLAGYAKMRELLSYEPASMQAAISTPGDSGGPLTCLTKTGQTGIVGIFSTFTIVGMEVAPKSSGLPLSERLRWQWTSLYKVIRPFVSPVAEAFDK